MTTASTPTNSSSPTPLDLLAWHPASHLRAWMALLLQRQQADSRHLDSISRSEAQAVYGDNYVPPADPEMIMVDSPTTVNQHYHYPPGATPQPQPAPVVTPGSVAPAPAPAVRPRKPIPWATIAKVAGIAALALLGAGIAYLVLTHRPTSTPAVPPAVPPAGPLTAPPSIPPAIPPAVPPPSTAPPPIPPAHPPAPPPSEKLK